MRSSPLLFALACLGLMAAVVSATCADLQSAYGNPTDILSGVTFNSKAGVPTHTVNNLAVIFTQGTTYTAKRDQACAPSPVGNQPAWSISTAGTTFLGQASPGADINAGAAGESGFIFTCCTASLSKRDLVSSQPFTCTGGFMCFPFSVVNGPGGGGDPAFYAFHSGTKFHWHGTSGQVFVILSDAHFQLNALLEKNLIYGGGHGTWMSAFGLRARNASMIVHANRSISINDKPARHFSTLSKADLALLSPTFSEFEIRKHALHLHVPNWGLTIKFASYSKHNITQTYLDFSIEDMFSGKNVSERVVEGVLGGTYATHGVPHTGKCNVGSQGGCMVPFPPATYFVPNRDLLSTQWARAVYTDGEHLAVHNVRSKAPVVAGTIKAEPHKH